MFSVYLDCYRRLSRVVSQYYQCAENITHTPFIDPVEVIACDHRGIRHTLTDQDITLDIPEGAVPKERVVHLELAVALYGPFSFPANTRPISPILWLCPQEEVEIKSPIRVTLPHFVTGVSEEELSKLGVTFAKADHNDYSGSKESRNVTFNFQTHSEQSNFFSTETQSFGTLETRHCCYLCITAQQCPELARQAGFYFSRIDYVTKSSTYVTNFCVSFYLPSCIRVCLFS